MTLLQSPRRLRTLAVLGLLIGIASLLPASVHGQPVEQSPATSVTAAPSDEFTRLFETIQSGTTAQRRQLALSIDQVSPEFRIPLLRRLLADPHDRVKAAALETARQLPKARELQVDISRLKSSTTSALVRQHAELVLSEWEATADRQRSTSSPLPARPPLLDSAVRPASTLAPAITPIDTADAVVRPANAESLLPRGDSPVPRSVPPAPAIDEQSQLNADYSDFEQSLRSFEQTFESVTSSRRLPPLPREELPEVLRNPDAETLDSPDIPLATPESQVQPGEYLTPLGFTGPSGILPSEAQSSPHFVPVPDRWRSGFPDWDRLEDPDDPQDNYPYTKGHWWDPYNQNVLKGDYPIIGQHTFLNVTASSQMIHEYRQVPTPTTPFESTVNPFQEEFFGNPDQYFYTHFLTLNLELFHGSTAFKPFDWRIRVAPVLNFNYLDTEELGIVNPDVREGTTRFRDYLAMEQWFIESKITDIGPDYDFLSTRIGSQPIVTDFRGLVLADINRGVRLFGTLNQNREQFNIWWLDQTEKDTNSQLNSFDDRHQNTIVLNYFRQDTFVLGYTLSASFHYNRDQSSVEFDDNDFLVRPDPAGIFQPHEVEAFYYGLAGDGHFGILNVSHAFYHVQGSDSRSPLGGEQSDINANMAAVELSVDRDWIRFRSSYFWASGDDDPNDGKAEGFDTILDNPNFAGGEFSYWNRQEIRLFGLGLSQRLSLVPNLRSSKIQGQSNFVNPGIHIVNLGMDFEITPKTKAISNINWLWFDETAVLEQFAFQGDIDPKIGIDLSLGMEYRPLLNDNIQVIGGLSMLVPDRGIKDLYGITDPFTRQNAHDTDVDNLYAGFVDLILTY